jgi:hypothetical protein
MTYMFENPFYHQISLAKDVENNYPRYSLYSYCEGVRCDDYRRNRFTGMKSIVQFILKTIFSYRFTGIVHRW